MQRDDNVGHTCWAEYPQAHASGDKVAWRVLFMGIVGLDVEIGYASRLGSEGRCDARQNAASRRGGGRGAVGN